MSYECLMLGVQKFAFIFLVLTLTPSSIINAVLSWHSYQLEKRRWREYVDFLGDIRETNCKMNDLKDLLFDRQNWISSDHHDQQIRKKLFAALHTCICNSIHLSQ